MFLNNFECVIILNLLIFGCLTVMYVDLLLFFGFYHPVSGSTATHRLSIVRQYICSREIVKNKSLDAFFSFYMGADDSTPTYIYKQSILACCCSTN